MSNLEAKVALMTGAASGRGLATARIRDEARRAEASAGLEEAAASLRLDVTAEALFGAQLPAAALSCADRGDPCGSTRSTPASWPPPWSTT
jgi:NADP-dependent 3-hydroxy acid dehydrogenase YdfG